MKSKKKINMPTRKLHRFWCSKCKEFTLHKTWGDKSCTECGTVTDTYNISDVPEEKLLEQRKRYSASQPGLHTYLDFLRPKSQLEQLAEMFAEDERTEIIETDAGQKEIDERRAKERAKEMAEKRRIHEERKAEVEKYKNLGRNDKCACGSGKKYKQCCLVRIESYKI